VPALAKRAQALRRSGKATHVGQDHDAHSRRLVGRGVEGCEAVAVDRLELEIVVRDGAPAIGGTGGSESGSKHTPATIVDNG